MGVMTRVDYRYLRLISVPAYVVALVLLVLVFVPSLNYVVGGSARFLQVGPLPAVHPAEIGKIALVIYLAHWFAKTGTRVGSFWRGTLAFLVIVAPIVMLVVAEPDLGTTAVITLTASVNRAATAVSSRSLRPLALSAGLRRAPNRDPPAPHRRGDRR